MQDFLFLFESLCDTQCYLYSYCVPWGRFTVVLITDAYTVSVKPIQVKVTIHFKLPLLMILCCGILLRAQV